MALFLLGDGFVAKIVRDGVVLNGGAGFTRRKSLKKIRLWVAEHHFLFLGKEVLRLWLLFFADLEDLIGKLLEYCKI